MSQQKEPQKSGKWSEAEKLLLTRNIQEYAREMNQDPHTLLTSKKARDKTFWGRAGEGINRAFLPVYKQAHRIFGGDVKTGAYTAEEDRKLRQLYADLGKNWKKIAFEMQRSDQSCRDRWRVMEYENVKSGKWDQQEIDMLIKAVHETTGTMVGQRVDEGVHWRAVAQKHGTRSEKQCRVMWYDRVNYQQASQTAVPVLWTVQELTDVVGAIIALCHARGYTSHRDIPWRELAQQFPQRSPHELNQRFLAVWRKTEQSLPFEQRLQDAQRRAASGKAPRTNGVTMARAKGDEDVGQFGVGVTNAVHVASKLRRIDETGASVSIPPPPPTATTVIVPAQPVVVPPPAVPMPVPAVAVGPVPPAPVPAATANVLVPPPPPPPAAAVERGGK